MSESISYTLRFPAPHTHYVEVEAAVPTGGRPAVEMMMAVWTPGSYLVREFARHVEDLTAAAEDGTPLAVEKTAKNRWRIATAGAPRVKLRYRLYGREMSVRTNFVEAGFALLNGAATFLTLADGGARPHEVRVVLPPGWRTAISPLPHAPGGERDTFLARDFDTLVDSPLYAGSPAVHEFEVAGRPHLLVDEGEGTVWDGARAAAELAQVSREVAGFWGVVPYARYIFFNLLTEESGGLEHRESTVLMTSRWRSRTREGRLDWLSLAAHELFHAWNVKRLHPVELDRFDYERESYTRSLWIVEGLTSYYDDLFLARAGLANREEYLKRLSKQVETLETSPGRLTQPIADASYDTWIKYYRRDENFVNSGVSYYTKGAVLGFLLDARIRRSTGGARSLDDALRLAYRRFGAGYREEEFRRLLSEVAGEDLGPWLAHTVDAAQELDYGEALGWYGLRFTEKKKEDDEEEGATTSAREPAVSASKGSSGGSSKEPSGWLGIETELRNSRLVVTEVKRGTPGEAGGINVDDEILAIGDYRVPPEGWKERLKAYRPGEKATLLVARRELLVRLPITFGAEPPRRFLLEPDPRATPEQRAHLAAWLASSPAPPEAPSEVVPSLSTAGVARD